MNAIRLLTIGASAGGISALQTLFSSLSPEFDLPIIVTLHLPPTAEVDMSLIFQRYAENRLIFMAEDKMPIEKKAIYFASPGYHLLIESDQTLSVSLDEPVCFSRPSINVLFESAARSFPNQTLGILLTGANEDGAAGLKAIQQSGGYTIVQDPNDADAKFSPQYALRTLIPDLILPIKDIGPQLNRFFLGKTTIGLNL